MTIINLTPHAITFLDGNNSVLKVVEPSGTIARAAQTRVLVGDIDGLPVNQCRYGEVTGLPEAQPGTIYIVSVPGRRSPSVGERVVAPEALHEVV